LNLFVTLAGFIVGALVGFTGIGAAALMTPALILIVGVRPIVAVGTDLVYSAITRVAGAWQHQRQGTVDISTAFYLALGSVPASLVGVALLFSLLGDEGEGVDLFITRVLGVVLVLVSLVILASSLIKKRSQNGYMDVESRPTPRSLYTVAIGAMVGLTVGLTSVGSGSLLVPFLIFLYPLSTNKVVGTDIFHAAMLTAAAGLAHFGAGTVDLPLVGNLLLGSVPGILLGSRFAARVPDRVLKPVLASVLLLVGLRLA
jgi:hypothetical protein